MKTLYLSICITACLFGLLSRPSTASPMQRQGSSSFDFAGFLNSYTPEQDDEDEDETGLSPPMPISNEDKPAPLHVNAPVIDSLLAKQDSTPKFPPKFGPLPPSKPLIILDLDETLIHSVSRLRNADGLDVIRISTGAVVKRPNLTALLLGLARFGTLAVWTHGSEDYAREIINHIDPDQSIFGGRVLTAKDFGRSTKDLTSLGYDLKRVLLIDDKQMNFLPLVVPIDGTLVPTNGYQVKRMDLEVFNQAKIDQFIQENNALYQFVLKNQNAHDLRIAVLMHNIAEINKERQ